MRLALAAAVLLLAGAVGRAEALTIRDVIELTKAGVSEEVLLALIDVDGGVYASDTETLKALKEAGVSERVMVALVRSGRRRCTARATDCSGCVAQATCGGPQDRASRRCSASRDRYR